MRSILAAALILATPAILPAQAMHTGISSLVASVDAPAFLFQASAVRAAAPAITGALIAPVRLNAMKLVADPLTHSGEAEVHFTVNAAGMPENVQVVKSIDAHTDARIAEAVEQTRYTPGQLHGINVAVPVNLTVNVK